MKHNTNSSVNSLPVFKKDLSSEIFSPKAIHLSSDLMTESYTAAGGTQLKYTTGYVKVNSATPVTEGPVKGVATFTIDYTL